MTRLVARAIAVLLGSIAASLASCTTAPPASEVARQPDVEQFVVETSATSVLGTDAQFTGSTYPDVALDGLFPVRGPEACEMAVLDGGEDSFAVRLAALKNARRSIRIQALIFQGDETGHDGEYLLQTLFYPG